MIELFELFATIGLKDDGFYKGLEDAAVKSEAFASRFGAAIDGVPAAWKKLGQPFVELSSLLAKSGDEAAEIGSNIVTGLWKGISEKTDWLGQKVNGFFSGMMNGVRSLLGIHSPSAVFAEKVGKPIAEGVAQGIDDHADKVSSAAEKLSEDAYSRAKRWIEGYRAEEEYLASEELKMWQYLSSVYNDASAERVEIDRNTSSLREEIAARDFESSKKWIETRKFFGLLSLQEEAEAWEIVQGRYLEGTKEREEADRNLYSAQKALMEARLEILNQIEMAEQGYTRAVEDRAEVIYRSYGLFDELRRKEAVTSQELTLRLQDQVMQLKTWAENLATLAARGVDEAFLDELRGMGPAAAAEIAVLRYMTEGELNNYQHLWKQKHKLAVEEAIGELQPLREETNLVIQELMFELDKTLQSSAAITGQTAISTLLQSMQAENEALSASIRTLVGDSVAVGASTGIAQSEGTAKSSMRELAVKVMASASEVFSNVEAFFAAGVIIMEQLKAGMESKLLDLAASAAEMARQISEAFQASLTLSLAGTSSAMGSQIGAGGWSPPGYDQSEAKQSVSPSEAMSTVSNVFNIALGQSALTAPLAAVTLITKALEFAKLEEVVR